MAALSGAAALRRGPSPGRRYCCLRAREEYADLGFTGAQLDMPATKHWAEASFNFAEEDLDELMTPYFVSGS